MYHTSHLIRRIYTVIFLYVVLFENVNSEETTKNVKELIESYKTNLNSSIALAREDKELMSSWTLEFQVQRVNITTKYRIQMSKHMEYSFYSEEHNNNWRQCVDLNKRQISKSEKDYYENESVCLKTTSSGDVEKKKYVEQVEKEMRKWRRGYRYLVNSCSSENPGDVDSADICLIELMERDNYNQVIVRLLVLKLEAMGDLYLHLNTSVYQLEECLKRALSHYLDKVRAIMESTTTCYNRLNSA